MTVGRNRGFVPEQAIEAAMTTFWQRGFNGTSLSDLTAAMGINKSSLYGTFKSKASLFVSAVEHYAALHAKPSVETLLDTAEPDPMKKIRCYLLSIVDLVTADACPGGCLIANSTCEVNEGTLPPSVAEAILRLNQKTKASLIRFFATEMEKGTLVSSASAQSLADYLQSMQFGLAVMAKNGAGRTALVKVVDISLSAFAGSD